MVDKIAENRNSKLLWDDLEMYSVSSESIPSEFCGYFKYHLPAFFIQYSLFFDTENYPICYSSPSLTRPICTSI